MAGCFWHGRRKSKTNLGVNGLISPTIEPTDEVKDEFFDSRLIFESDSDDDFMSVNGDSLPSTSFGYPYSNPGTPRPSFTSLRERTENVALQNGVDGTHTASQNDPRSSDEKKTLKELFTHKPDADKKPESENTQLVSRQSSSKDVSGQLHDKASQKSCLPGLLSSVGINVKKSPSSPEPNKSKTTQHRLPFRLCAS